MHNHAFISLSPILNLHNPTQLKALLDNVLTVAVTAGREILGVYENDFDVDYKGDGSPVTVADQRAHEHILAGLHKLTPAIPVLSEESDRETFEARRQWKTFWLVDPLDGTREFVKRNGEFTVNIALIDNASPVLGVVHTPTRNISHYAADGVGAFRKEGDLNSHTISTRKMYSGSMRSGSMYPRKVTMVTSRSHSGTEVEKFHQNLKSQVGEVDIISIGSSLKICLVAEGSADIYPRLGPTSEWDTAAAHCVLEVAGGRMIDLRGNRLQYNKSDILNPWFLACGDKLMDWAGYIETNG